MAVDKQSEVSFSLLLLHICCCGPGRQEISIDWRAAGYLVLLLLRQLNVGQHLNTAQTLQRSYSSWAKPALTDAGSV